MTPADLEDLISRELQDFVGDVRTSDALVQSTVERSVSGLRSTRRRQLLVGSAVAGVAAVAAWQLPGALDEGERNDTPITHHQAADGPGSFAWAESLPRGDDARAAYVVGHTMYVGNNRVDLGDGNYAEPKAPVDGGWFATYGQIDEVGNWVDVKRGVLAPGGSFRPFAYQPQGHLKPGHAVSPDGSQVVYDATVVDVETGEVVAELPDKARFVESWTSQGIAYQDHDSTTWLWTATSNPRLMGDWTFLSPEFAVLYGPGCTSVGRLESTGDITEVGILCNGVSSISPTGAFAVSASGQVERVQNGQVLLNLDVPPPMDGLAPLAGSYCCAYHWEDDDTLLVVVGNVAVEDVSWLFVRCQVETAACERASDVLSTATLPYPASPSLEP
jgi:hypothetical protein